MKVDSMEVEMSQLTSSIKEITMVFKPAFTFCYFILIWPLPPLLRRPLQ